MYGIRIALSLSGLGKSFFFFQAEDGIRDGHVTGVQTCALPIWPSSELDVYRNSEDGLQGIALDPDFEENNWRSEERRVGKECKCRGWPEQYKKKQAHMA